MLRYKITQELTYALALSATVTTPVETLVSRKHPFYKVVLGLNLVRLELLNKEVAARRGVSAIVDKIAGYAIKVGC